MTNQSLSHRLRIPLAIALTLATAGWLGAQQRRPAPPPKPPVNASTNPLLRPFVFRSIGPATMLGRVDDIEGTPQDPMLLYVGFATGGLWRSTDGGLHWTSLWDSLPNESVGAIGIAPSDENVVYVGSGEANNRQSSSLGDGVWGTRDGGKTWHYLGLGETQAIGGIAVDPRNPDVVYVAANGHLFGPNSERGLYKTTDGGKTWTKAKYIDENTGFEDVEIDPSDSNLVYATSYQHRRTWWGYDGGGPNSGLWKSTDAGQTWTRLDGSGWPKPKDGLYGRIDVSIFRANPKILYAQVEAGASAGVGGGTDINGGPQKPRTGPPEAGPRKPEPPNPNGSGVYRSEDGGKTWTFMSNQDQRPMYFSRIRVDPKNSDKVLVGGTPGQISMDGGKTWKPMTGSHTDYHAIWISPSDPRIVLIGHDGGFDISHDGGQSWYYNNNMAVGQFYQVSTDMRHPYWVCGGLQDNNAWCGPSAVRNNTGPINADWFTVAGGDGFYTRQDPADYNIVYGESQDGNMTRHDFRNGTQINIRPRFSSPANQGGFFPGGPGNIINQPKDDPALRYYWNAPFEISPFNPNKIYMGAQFFFYSTDRGNTWTMNPEDLTKNMSRWSASNNIMGVPDNQPMVEKNDGLSASSIITQIRESPSQPGEIWVGTDDGNLQLSLDGGKNFNNLIANLDASVPSAPKGYVLVSRIEPSHFSGAVAYVALDNHRNDDYHPYLYKTTDYGKTWTDLTANLPAMGEIQAFREDSRNPNLLFVGTEFGLFLSTNGGQSYEKFMTGLPEVPVNDILIQPRERDLILATHGRSIWIADDITPLEQLGNIGDADVHLFDPRAAVEWKSDLEDQPHVYQDQFHGQNPQGGTAIDIWAKSDMGAATIDFLKDGKVVSTMTEKDIHAGMNRFQWNMRGIAPKPTKAQEAQMRRFRRFRGRGSRGVPFVAAGGGGFGRFTGQGPLLAPGSYIVRVTVGGKMLTSSVNVEADVWLHHEN